MPKCVYCGKMYDIHKGLTLVKNDGSINHFCSSKCRKSKAMKRRKVRWILKSRKTRKEREAEIKERSEER
jgi:ribosomal protein L24E